MNHEKARLYRINVPEKDRPKKPLTIRIDDKLFQDFKRLSQKKKTTFKACIEIAMVEFLERQK